MIVVISGLSTYSVMLQLLTEFLRTICLIMIYHFIVFKAFYYMI